MEQLILLDEQGILWKHKLKLVCFPLYNYS